MITTGMEMKRMGMLRKPMYVVPNHLIMQWASEFYKLYPGANLLAITKKDFEPINRKILFGRIASGDWDAVIIAHSSFGMIPVDVDEELAFYDTMLTEAIAAYKEFKDSEGATGQTTKQREKAIDKIKAKIKAAQDRRGKDDLLNFNELGVDGLFVDEAHMFKNLYFSTARPSSAGISTAFSQKAQHLYMVSQGMMARNGGRGLFFATGTPISNSIVEMYTMQRYLELNGLKDAGIHHFDAWVDTFADQRTEWELDSTGVRYKLKSRYAGFNNMPELIKMYRRFADSVSLRDLEDSFSDQGKKWPQPKPRGGSPQNIVVPRSVAQSDYMDRIILRAENMPTDPKEDNFLKLTNDARLAGLDMRLIDPNLPDNPNSKVNVAASNIQEIYNRTEADKGTQLVFIDLSVPKSAKKAEQIRIEKLIHDAENGDELAQEELDTISPDTLLTLNSKFDVYNDLKQKLVNKGIPENEIRFIHEANTDKQKEELFAKVNNGEVRILLGSTARMGAGMNVQQRLVALHHLDAPWRPSDIEQREGRILRQGNLLYQRDPDNFVVDIMRYSTEQTYDARMWQTLEIKAKDIEAVRAGATGRTVEDVGGGAADAAAMKAAASGNPLILEQVQLSGEIKKLEAQLMSHRRRQHNVESGLRRLEAGGGPQVRMDERKKQWQERIALRDKNTPEDPKKYRIDAADLSHKSAIATVGTAVDKAWAEKGDDASLFDFRGFGCAYDCFRSNCDHGSG